MQLDNILKTTYSVQLSEFQFLTGDNSSIVNNLENAIVSGVNLFYDNTGSAITVTPVVKTIAGTTLTVGTDYITKDGSTVTTVQEAGDYTMTITGTGSYYGSQTLYFVVLDAYIIGTGEPNLPAGARDFDDWDEDEIFDLME